MHLHNHVIHEVKKITIFDCSRVIVLKAHYIFQCFFPSLPVPVICEELFTYDIHAQFLLSVPLLIVSDAPISFEKHRRLC